MKALQKFLDWGGTRKDVALLVLSGLSLLLSIFHCAVRRPHYSRSRHRPGDGI